MAGVVPFSGKLDSVSAVPFAGELDTPAAVPFSGELDAAPSFLGAVGETLKQTVPHAVGGLLQTAGEVLSGQTAPMAGQAESPVDTVKGVAGKLARAFIPLKGGASLADALEVVTAPAKALHMGVGELARRGMPEELKQAAGEMADYGKGMAGSSVAAVQAATPRDMGIVPQAALSAIQSAAITAPAVVLNRVGLASPEQATKGVLGVFGAQALGTTYHEARSKGADPSTAFAAALPNALVEVGTEKMALDTLLRGESNWFKKYLLQEIGSEEMATIGQSAIEKGLYNPEKWDSADEIVHDLAVTALAAGMGAGAMKGVDSGVNAGMRLYEKKKQAREFDTQAAQAEATRVLARAAGIPDEEMEMALPPEPTEDLTPLERAQVTLQREQLKNGLDVAPTTDGVNYGMQVRAALGQSGLGQGGVAEADTQEDVGGMTSEVLARRERTREQGLLPIDQRQITMSSTDAGVVGLTLQQTGELPAGAVVAVGYNPELFPGEVYQPVMETLGQLAQTYMPDARIVLNLEQLEGQTFGNQTTVVNPKTGAMTHVITLRELPSWKYQGGDVKTRAALVGALAHEFGHALKVQNFYKGLQGMGSKGLSMVRDSVVKGMVGEDLLQAVEQVAPEEGRLLRTWQDLKGKIERGEMTAQEFLEQWAGLRKLGDSVNPQRGVRNKELASWARAALARAGKTLDGATALELIDAVYDGKVEYALNFDEFMAEQFSRAAYVRGDLERSPLGKFFRTTLDALRNLFRTLKAEKLVEPQETFQDWLDKQTALAKAMKKPTGKFRLPKGVQAAQKKVLAEKGMDLKGRPLEKQKEAAVPPPAPEVKAAQVDEKQATVDLVSELFVQDRITEKQLDRYLDKIERGQLLQVQESLQRLLGSEYNLDVEYSSKVLQRLPNKAWVKAETLKATIARADTKARERAMWEGFLQRHPEGFTLAEAEEELRNNVLPLTVEYSAVYADYGSHVVRKSLGIESLGSWASPIQPYYFTNLYTNPDVLVSEKAQKHFTNARYVMHARNADTKLTRYVLELQSDVFGQEGERLDSGVRDLWQDLGETRNWWKDTKAELEEVLAEGAVEDFWQVFTHTAGLVGFDGKRADYASPKQALVELEKHMASALQSAESPVWKAQAAQKLAEDSILPAWWERLIREEVARAVDDRKQQIFFPTADTVAAIEGWELEGKSASLAGREVPDLPGVHWTGQVWKMVDGTLVGMAGHEGMIIPEEQTPSDAVFSYGKQQGLYDLYKQGMEKYLKKTYFAELEDHNGITWLKVNLNDKTNVVTNWDRENPYQPEHPSTVLDTFAGLGVEELKDKAKVSQAELLWKEKGFESPFFKRWFRDSKVLGMNGQPVEVYASAGVPADAYASWFVANYANAQGKAGGEQRAQPQVRGYYLRIENPLEIDLGGRLVTERELREFVGEARGAGKDGVVLRGGKFPLDGTMYATFERDAVVQVGKLQKRAEWEIPHWDAESEGQQAAKVMSRALEGFWEKGKLQAGNTWAKMVDSLMQLQQVAAAQPEMHNLQMLLQKAGRAMQLKNNLQLPAEELVKEVSALWGQSAERVKLVHGLLKAEWAQGKLAAKVQGFDHEGELVWGEEVGVGLEQQAKVASWAVQDGVGLREWMRTHGVDATTEEGKAVLGLYLKTRNLFLNHFNELGKALKVMVAHKLAGQPLMQKEALVKINGLMSKLLLSPFVPQGNFGNYVLTVKKDQGPVAFGQRRYVTIWRKHFESKAEFDAAHLKALKQPGVGIDLKVETQILTEESKGLPMQLPAGLLEMLEQTGDFTSEQLVELEGLLSVDKYDRIAARFEAISKQMAGGSEDFARILADFGGRNANYIWKLRYRFEMQQSISAEKHLVRRLERNFLGGAEELKAEIERRRRNIALMESAFGYMLNPGNELQAMRSFITLVYLGYNVKTALMNISTVLNTAAAVGSEYGEAQGLKEWGRSLGQTLHLLWYRGRENASPLEKQEDNELLGVLEQAVQDGVVDQSYAYFLAAHANASPLLAATGGKANRVFHAVSELGMLPFQTMEKVVRIHTLLTYYKLEKAAGSGGRDAYNLAVKKTNLLQNSYEAINRPWVFREKRAIFTMFMSFTQFMGYMTLGGYEKGARAEAEMRGRAHAPGWRGTTVKLLLIYAMLGGMMGVPFARNILDIVQWLGRKLGGWNAEVELRKFLEDMGLESNFAMHGLLHNFGGFDLSGSFGLGRMLPGTDILTKEKEMNSLEVMGSLLAGGAGPAGNFYKSVIESVGYLAEDSSSKWGWLNAAKAMPGALGGVGKAADAYLRQMYKPTYGVTTKDGRRMTWDKETGEFRDLTTKELAGMALGFNPTVLAENREQNYAVMSEVFYWQTRRSDLMDRHWQAMRSGDAGLRLEVRQAVVEYNKQIPERALAITGKDLNDSTKAHKKQVKKGEELGTAMKKYRGVARATQEAYMKGGD